MKMLDMVNLTRSLPILMEQKLPVAVSLRLLRISDAVNKEAEIYNQALAKIKEGKGAEEAYKELLESESTLEIERIPVGELGDIQITPLDLGRLEHVLELGE